AQIAVSRLARRRDPRLDDPRGAHVSPRADRACDAARVRLPPPMAGRRSGDVGQPADHASRPPLRPQRGTRRAPYHARRRGTDDRAGRMMEGTVPKRAQAALAVADRALARGFDAALPPAWRKFFYMPFHHSEDLADQRRARALAESLPEDRDPDPERGGLRRYGQPYIDVIARFGRFPHRNAILGRASTAEEIAFMQEVRASS